MQCLGSHHHRLETLFPLDILLLIPEHHLDLFEALESIGLFEGGSGDRTIVYLELKLLSEGFLWGDCLHLFNLPLIHHAHDSALIHLVDCLSRVYEVPWNFFCGLIIYGLLIISLSSFGRVPDRIVRGIFRFHIVPLRDGVVVAVLWNLQGRGVADSFCTYF